MFSSGSPGIMNIRDILSDEEISQVTHRSDWRGGLILISNWLFIFAIFWLVAYWTNPLSIFLAIVLLGGRQMGLGVIVHECGHRILFKTPWLNRFCGTWLAGYPVFSDMDSYMRGHLLHHRNAGTRDDPDLSNYRDYPIPRSRLRRKIWRDVSGQVGWRRIKSIGQAIGGFSSLQPATRRYVIRSLAANTLLLVILAVAGYAWIYGLWVIAFMTSHMLVTRLRQIGEHAAVPDRYDPDPRSNTRTVYTSWLDRLFIAPFSISYHLEHHLLASAPIYRLRKLHHLLLSKGFYRETDFPRGYINLLRQVSYPG
jgi:fatty acid desaturase